MAGSKVLEKLQNKKKHIVQYMPQQQQVVPETIAEGNNSSRGRYTCCNATSNMTTFDRFTHCHETGGRNVK